MKKSPYSEKELLDLAFEFKKHLNKHFSALSEEFPELDLHFMDKFKALFYEARAYSNKISKDEYSEEALAELDELINQIKKLYLIIRFYLQKAFPYDYINWEQYGYCEAATLTSNHESLRVCFEGFIKLIREKRAELLSANCPFRTLDEMELLTNQFSDKYMHYLNQLEKIQNKTDSHHSDVEKLYQMMLQINNASVKCFENNPEILIKLTFPARKSNQ